MSKKEWKGAKPCFIDIIVFAQIAFRSDPAVERWSTMVSIVTTREIM